MRSRIVLCLWLLGILFPMAYLGRFSIAYRSAFNAIFGPNWVHVVMHAALYAGLVFLLIRVLHWQINWRTFILICGLVAGVGIFQEILQSLSTGNFAVWGVAYDLGVDLIGGSTAAAIAYLIQRNRHGVISRLTRTC